MKRYLVQTKVRCVVKPKFYYADFTESFAEKFR